MGKDITDPNNYSEQYIYYGTLNIENGINTSFPSGKQRQKKSGRGRPTAFFIAFVITEVTKAEYRRAATIN